VRKGERERGREGEREGDGGVNYDPQEPRIYINIEISRFSISLQISIDVYTPSIYIV